MKVTGECVTHALESKFPSLTDTSPNVLLMSEVVGEALANQSHTTKCRGVSQSDMTQNFDNYLRRYFANRAWWWRSILNDGIRLWNRRMCERRNEIGCWKLLPFSRSWTCYRRGGGLRWRALRGLLPYMGVVLVPKLFVDGRVQLLYINIRRLPKLDKNPPDMPSDSVVDYRPSCPRPPSRQRARSVPAPSLAPLQADV